MKKITLNQEVINENFDELSEECQFATEGGCGGGWGNANHGYSGQYSWWG